MSMRRRSSPARDWAEISGLNNISLIFGVISPLDIMTISISGFAPEPRMAPFRCRKAIRSEEWGRLPAFGFNEFPGDTLGANRMLLMNAEYILNGDFLGDLDFWPSFIMRHVNLILVADAGLVRTASAETSPFSGFGGIKWNEFRSDLGFGISNRSGSCRWAGCGGRTETNRQRYCCGWRRRSDRWDHLCHAVTAKTINSWTARSNPVMATVPIAPVAGKNVRPFQ